MYKDMIPADVLAREGQDMVPRGCDPDATELAALDQQAKEANRRYVQVSADFANFKKRVAEEVERRSTASKDAFICELLPVFENLRRALANSAPAPDPLRRGLEMTYQQFLDVMRAHGFERHGEIGQAFDPNFHEAVCVRSEPRYPDQAIVEVWQRGWLRNGKLFIPAKVVVNNQADELIWRTPDRASEPSHV